MKRMQHAVFLLDFVREGDDSLPHWLFGFDQESARGTGEIEQFIEGGDSMGSGIAAEIKQPQFAKPRGREIGNPAAARGSTVERVIVEDDGNAVGTKLHIAFAPQNAGIPRGGHGRERIFGQLGVQTAMGDDDGRRNWQRTTMFFAPGPDAGRGHWRSPQDR